MKLNDLLKSIKTQGLKGYNNSVSLFLKAYLVEDGNLLVVQKKRPRKLRPAVNHFQG